MQPNEDILETIRNLKNHGITTAILTNNWKSEINGRLIFNENLELFDHVIESCLVGMRKPEIKIYEHALKTVGVSGSESIFLDDISGNLKPAAELGITPIHVKNVPTALTELQNLLKLDLGYVPGTTFEFRKGMNIDKEAVKNYLVTQLGLESSGEITIKQFEHGQSNPTYLVTYLGKKYVLRKKPPGKLLPGAHAIEREYR